MTEVTRFPHYHQKENIVTNHVMVMLRMLYSSSPKLLESLLQALCANEVTIGPQFSQQISGSHSVPDGLILQESLAIFIETKLGTDFETGQLERHCNTIINRLPNRTRNFLISLTSGHSELIVPDNIIALGHKYSITIVRTNFRELVEQIVELSKTDSILRDTAQEFSDFIYSQGLITKKDQFLVAMLTGTSWNDNVTHGVYYESVNRNQKWRLAAFLGLYHDRHVSHVGRIVTSVAAVKDESGELVFDLPEEGNLDDGQRRAVQDVVDSAQPYYPDFQINKYRYYIVDKFEKTEFSKSTPYGMRGHRYFDIENITGSSLPKLASGLAAAEALNGRSYK